MVCRKSLSGYFMLWIWLPCGALLNMAYESNLRAGLVAVELERPVETFQVCKRSTLKLVHLDGIGVQIKDLLDRGITVAIPENTVLTYIMVSSPLPVVQQVYEKAYLYKMIGSLDNLPPEVLYT